MVTLKTNDTAPDFLLGDALGRHWSLKDFSGGKLILYFYPAASTPGCTIEAVDFTASRDAFAAAGYQIVGISPDAPEKLARFIDNNSLTVTLLSNEDKSVLQAYGAWGTKTLYGKQMEGVIRSTFVLDVDATGVGVVTIAQYNVKATGHVERLAKLLGVIK